MIPLSREELSSRLQVLAPVSLRIEFHRHRSKYAQVMRAKDGSIVLSIHELYTYATTPVLQALIRFALRQDKRSRLILRQMAHIYFTKICPPAADSRLFETKGEFLDLKPIYDEQNTLYFQNKVSVPIAWCKKQGSFSGRRITFGYYDRTIPIIRIHRFLDRVEVPLPFVEFIVYHEMLHTVCEVVADMRRAFSIHTAEFRRYEALHPHYLFAKKWIQERFK